MLQRLNSFINKRILVIAGCRVTTLICIAIAPQDLLSRTDISSSTEFVDDSVSRLQTLSALECFFDIDINPCVGLFSIRRFIGKVSPKRDATARRWEALQCEVSDEGSRKIALGCHDRKRVHVLGRTLVSIHLEDCHTVVCDHVVLLDGLGGVKTSTLDTVFLDGHLELFQIIGVSLDICGVQKLFKV